MLLKGGFAGCYFSDIGGNLPHGYDSMEYCKQLSVVAITGVIVIFQPEL